MLLGLQPFVDDLKAAAAFVAAADTEAAAGDGSGGKDGAQGGVIGPLLDFVQRQQAAARWAAGLATSA